MRALFLSVLVLVAACSESFAPASAVTELRVVAAKVEVRDDPERANPSPDEGLQVSLLTIDQGAPASDVPEEPSLTPGFLQWSFFPCVPLPVTLGTPLCGPVIACEGCEGTPPEDPLATPVMQFQTPSEEELAMFEASSVLLQGIVCSNGPPAGQDAILRFLAGETDDLEPCRDEPVIEGVPVEGRFVAVTIPIEDDPSDPT